MGLILYKLLSFYTIYTMNYYPPLHQSGRYVTRLSGRKNPVLRRRRNRDSYRLDRG